MGGRGACRRGGNRRALGDREGVEGRRPWLPPWTGDGETSPSANKAHALTPRPLPRPHLTDSTAQWGGTGHRLLARPASLYVYILYDAK